MERIIPELHSLLDMLTPAQQEYLLKNCMTRRYKEEDIIHIEGETPAALMCLMKGRIKIYRMGVSGKSQIIRVLKPGALFGYQAFYSGESFGTSAAALENCLLCIVPMSVVTNLLRENSDMALFFIRCLSKDLSLVERRMVTLTHNHLRGRLAEALLYLRKSQGTESDGVTLSIYISREDLANLSNMTTANAIRTLSQFADERLVIVDGRCIKLINLERLEHLSTHN